MLLQKTVRCAGATVALMILLTGCQSSEGTQLAAQPSAPNKPASQAQEDIVVYDDLDESGYKNKYQFSDCVQSSCFLSTQPASAPIHKPDGSPICINDPYEGQLVVTVRFTYEGRLEGDECQIGKDVYDHINQYYGEDRLYRSYSDHKLFDAFQTWKTKRGFVTTFREVKGQEADGGIKYAYRLYVGPLENSVYAK